MFIAMGLWWTVLACLGMTIAVADPESPQLSLSLSLSLQTSSYRDTLGTSC